MARPGRPLRHVHNWQLRVEFKSGLTQVEPDAWGNNAGFVVERYWECIRGSKVKHVSPSNEYPVPEGLYGQRRSDFSTEVENRTIFLRASGTWDFDQKV